ncbi:zincin [Violaceomyces palustris]|uniref:Zincin n=1 Tax=Violaceomyces palustris TaxID=1673888 RepID=A0ACD0NR96_9BASI|nr:zincin [Violaceomyces palustris]
MASRSAWIAACSNPTRSSIRSISSKHSPSQYYPSPSAKRTSRFSSALHKPTESELGRSASHLRCQRKSFSSTSARALGSPRAKLAENPPLFSNNPAHYEADNLQLRALIDSPSSSSTSNSSTASITPTGLFQVPSLTSPDQFITLAQKTLSRAQLLVDRIVRADPEKGGDLEELRKVIRNFDRLSDLLCGVIDMAELVRNAHPDQYWAEAANAAYEFLCGYLNILNTHVGLYQVLKKLLSVPEITSTLSQEALSVARLFLRDFETSGIHLPPAERERFVQLSDEILVLGRAFLQDISGNGSGEGGATNGSSLPDAEFPVEWLKSLNPTLLTTLKSKFLSGPKAKVLRFSPTDQPWAIQIILKQCADERARKAAYVAANLGSKESVERLERLLKARAELAVLIGAESYAEMSLGGKMAKRPENVQDFLRALTRHHRPRASKDLDKLRILKHRQLASTSGADKVYNPSPSLPSFGAWDREIFTEQHFNSPHLRMTQPLSPYFSLGTVIAGLSRLFSASYGIRFRAATVAPGEVWSESKGDVIKVEVLDEREGVPGSGGGLIGTIYADLWSREGKPGGAAHYTVRCSRRVDKDDELGDFVYGRTEDGLPVSPEDIGAGDRGTASPLEVPTFEQRNKEGRYQLPVAVLMCDFARPGGGNSGACLLAWHDVETLFHEMGHAIHSMVGRTSYHNVSGTRCATDFVELPSILMEHFVASPSVISLMARHHSTDAKLPYEHLQQYIQASKSLKGLDTYHQIMLARLDQVYHSSRASQPDFDSTACYDELNMEMSLPGNERGSSCEGATPQTAFGHLFGYGATYYSYLFDRAIASKVWSSLFAKDPLSRESGEKFKDLLRHGGGRDPWLLLAELLGDERLASGGREAMSEVGRWGIDEVGDEVTSKL